MLWVALCHESAVYVQSFHMGRTLAEKKLNGSGCTMHANSVGWVRDAMSVLFRNGVAVWRGGRADGRPGKIIVLITP